jgi:predicted permease
MKLWNSFRMTATPRPNGTSRLRNDYTSSLWLLLGVTTLVLVMACANLANLTLARTLARCQEVATRLAIGASRYQVIAQLFTESMILAVAGTIAGAFLAGTLSKALVRFLNAQGITAELEVGMNWTVLVALGVTALIGCLFFGLTTALYATREKSIARLILGSRGTTGSSHRISFQGLLVAGQVGVSLVLVVSALLFLQSFQNLVTMDAGFVQEGIVYAYFNFPPDPTRPAGASRLDTETLEAVRRIPGIQSAATSTHLPLNGGRTTLGVPDPVTGRESFAYFTWISPGYFDTMEIPILAGRDFTTRDSADAPEVMLVNEKFARNYFGEEYPVGQTVRSLEEPGFPETVYQIVGLVANTRYGDLRDGIAPIAYLPYAQEPSNRIRAAIVTRSGLPAASVRKAVEDAVSNVHPGATVSATADLREQVLLGLSRERLLAWLGGFFGFLALTLVAVGLYGVVSYMVSNRRREIGIRMTLGANRRTVVMMILAETTWMMVLGCATGVGLALAILRLARRLLFGIGPTDPNVIGAGIGILLAVALAASYLPARASARTNPVETLRDG